MFGCNPRSDAPEANGLRPHGGAAVSIGVRRSQIYVERETQRERRSAPNREVVLLVVYAAPIFSGLCIHKNFLPFFDKNWRGNPKIIFKNNFFCHITT